MGEGLGNTENGTSRINSNCLPHPEFQLNCQGSVEPVFHRGDQADIRAKPPAFYGKHRQRCYEPAAIVIVRIAVAGAEDDPPADVYSRQIPMEGAPLIGSITCPPVIAVDVSAGEQFVIVR